MSSSHTEIPEVPCENQLGALRTLTAPAFLALTFLVSVFNTCRHVWKVLRRGGLLMMNPGIDSNLNNETWGLVIHPGR